MKLTLNKYILLFVFVLTSTITYSINYTWTGATNNTWELAANWTPSTSFPGIGDTATINSGGAIVELNVANQINRLYLNNGTLHLKGNILTVDTSIYINNSILDDGTYAAGKLIGNYVVNYEFVSTTTNSELEVYSDAWSNCGSNTYNGKVNYIHTGINNHDLSGTNTYNSTVIFRTINGRFRQESSANSSFNGDTLFIINNSAINENMYLSQSATATINCEVKFSNTSSGYIRIGSNGGTKGEILLNAASNFYIGTFTNGFLSLYYVKQQNPIPINITMLNSVSCYLYNDSILGDISITAGNVLLDSNFFNGLANFTKTGSLNNTSPGGNTFSMNTAFTNSGSGYLRLGSGNFDTFSANVTLTNSGSSDIYFAYNGLGHVITGDLTTINSGIGTGTADIFIANNATSSLTVTGNVSLTQNGSATTLRSFLGNQGDITINGTVSMTNTGTGTNSTMTIAENLNSQVSIAGTTTIANNSTAFTSSRMYLGNQGDVTFNGTLNLINSSGSLNSEVYCNYNSNSNNSYNENITLTTTNASSDGIRFGQNGGAGTLATTKTITIGGGGFIAGELRFRNFTQIGNTAHVLTLTGTGYLYNYDSDWGGDVIFIAPRNNTRGTLYNRTTYIEKTGATNDASAGGNTFTMDATFVNSGSGYLMMGNGTFDTFSANVTLTNSGTNNIYFANSGVGHVVSGNLISTNSATGTGTSNIFIANAATSGLTINGNVSLTQNGSATTLRSYLGNQGDITINGTVSMTNTGTGTNSTMTIAENLNSQVTIAGATTIANNSTAFTSSRMYLGNQGDVTFNGTLNLINSSGSPNSDIYANYNSNSNNLYNENITLTTTNASSDGIRFGQNGGAGTLAATKTITIGGSGFIAGELRFRNFTQVGATPQSLTLTGSGLLRFREANVFNGNLTTISPRLYMEGGTFNGITSLTKNGNFNDDSRGDCTFNGVTTITNSSSRRIRMSNSAAYIDDFNADVTFARSGTGTLEIARVGINTFAADVNINGNSLITFGQGGGTASFDGTIAQNINDALGASARPDFYNLQMNNTTNNLTLNMPIQVRTTIDLLNGNIITTATNLLIMADNSTVTTVSNTSYVSGPIEKVGNDIFTFPVGDNAFYRPISMSAPTGTTQAFRGQYFEANPDPIYNNTLKDPSIDHISQCEYWILDRIAGTSNVTVTLSWDANSCGVDSLSELIVARWDGALWRDHGNGGTTGNVSNGTIVTSGVVTAFSPFTLASTTAKNPLPIELISFSATVNENKVDLTWLTASEINNDYLP